MPWYRRVHAAIDACLPSLTMTQATNLALLVSAILVRRTLCLSELAWAWPRPATLAGLTFNNEAAQSTPLRVTSWSDGGPQSHTITAPATNTTCTAVYRKR